MYLQATYITCFPLNYYLPTFADPMKVLCKKEESWDRYIPEIFQKTSELLDGMNDKGSLIMNICKREMIRRADVQGKCGPLHNIDNKNRLSRLYIQTFVSTCKHIIYVTI